MPTPNTVDDVSRFVGMVTYYVRFIPNISTTTTTLKNIFKKRSKFLYNDGSKLNSFVSYSITTDNRVIKIAKLYEFSSKLSDI